MLQLRQGWPSTEGLQQTGRQSENQQTVLRTRKHRDQRLGAAILDGFVGDCDDSLTVAEERGVLSKSAEKKMQVDLFLRRSIGEQQKA